MLDYGGGIISSIDSLSASDVDFLIQQFSKIKDSMRFEKPSDFAERIRYLTADLTPFPGRFSYDKFPYFKSIVNLFDPADPTEEVVLMKGNQMGATTAILETLILYYIAGYPLPQMYVTADAGLMKTSVQTKIEKMIDNAGIRGLISSQNRKAAGSKDTGDTATAKEYPGGFLHCFGGRAPARFRGMTYRIALVDEIDSFPDKLGDEGSVIDLIQNRTNSYSGKKKILEMSTPLVLQTSKIYKLYMSGDQNKFFVPCKFCGREQELVWHGVNDDGSTYGITWENDTDYAPIIDSVGYKCKYCGKIMKNYDKSTIIPAGRWIPQSKSEDPKMHSFHLSPIYNPAGMFSWEDMVRLWGKAWDIRNNRVKDKEKYRVFRNTKQGLPFEETGTQIRYEKVQLHKRPGFVQKKVPNDLAQTDCHNPILILVASVDVQKHELFVDVKGYSTNESTWTVDFFSLDGDAEDFDGSWKKLIEWYESVIYVGTDGKQYRPTIMLVDSGRYTEYVYAFCGRYSSGVYACKGNEYITGGATYKQFDQATLNRIGLPLAYHINTTKLKDRISEQMNKASWNTGDIQPAWYPNFPFDFHDDYFRMFEAENKVDEYDRKTNKYLRTVWRQKIGAANHAFDTYVYNMAGLEIAADDYCRFVLGLPALNWDVFWKVASTGQFYTECKNIT